jgi:hypothetical protein
MDASTIGIGLAIAAAVFLSSRLQRQKNRKLATSLEPLLRERGPLTLPEVAAAIGMEGGFARGKVVLALNEMVTQGKLETIPAPDGTPQLQKVNFIKYRLRG